MRCYLSFNYLSPLELDFYAATYVQDLYGANLPCLPREGKGWQVVSFANWLKCFLPALD
jgi:hypothetical protein